LERGQAVSRVLVTGGCGFIGSHLVDRLVRKHEVIVVDLKKRFVNEKATYVEADILDQKKMEDIAKDIDTIFHMAADPNVKESVNKPMESFRINVKGTVSMLESARKNDVKNFVFASSSTVYGLADPKTKEVAPILPISPYGASKAACDAYISAYSHSYGMTGISCVLGNIFGPRSDHGVMYDFFHKLKRNPDELMILGNGLQKKSYLYITDTISAMLLVATKANGYQKFNITSDEWVTVNDIAEIISDEIGLKPKFRYTGGEAGWRGDVPRFKLDISRVKKFGFVPKVSTEQGIRMYVKYLSKS
jgi:UDP-glucose 4-epimerase